MSTQLSEVTFKEAVRTYVELHDEIVRCGKDLRELKKKKNDLSKAIIEFMNRNGIDEFQVPDGKLQRQQRTRKEGMKNEYVLECLRQSLGDEKAAALIEAIDAQRNTVQTEFLRRTQRKNE